MNYLRSMFTAWAENAKTVRCAVCRSTDFCQCDGHSTSVDAAPSMSLADKFAQFCELNPSALECRIYED